MKCCWLWVKNDEGNWYSDGVERYTAGLLGGCDVSWASKKCSATKGKLEESIFVLRRAAFDAVIMAIGVEE